MNTEETKTSTADGQSALKRFVMRSVRGYFYPLIRLKAAFDGWRTQKQCCNSTPKIDGCKYYCARNKGHFGRCRKGDGTPFDA
jgi:hypothetical protein